MDVIIFDKTNDSDPTGVGVITPVLKSGLTIEEIAAKDVPNGAAYEIVDDSVLPLDNPRELWEWE